MGRKNARIGLLKLLYQFENNKFFDKTQTKLFIECFFNDENEEDIQRVVNCSNNISDNNNFIDEKIKSAMEGWSFDRLSMIDKSILRLAVYEIFYEEDIPKEVSINEAIELAKKFSTTDSYKYINSILGTIIKNKSNM